MKILVDEMPSDKGECSFSDTFWNGYFWDYCCSLGPGGVTDCDFENGKCSKLHSFQLKLMTTTPYENVNGR